MTDQVRPRIGLLAAALLLASCGTGESATIVEDQITTTTQQRTTTTADQRTAETALTTGECSAPATELELESPTSFEIVGRDQPPGERLYFCVEIPEGVSGVSFELTEMSADLNLYVGHPDLETVQNGGLWFWSSDERGTDDKTVVAKPGLEDHVNPGPYYIEVSGHDFEESSGFTITVSAE